MRFFASLAGIYSCFCFSYLDWSFFGEWALGGWFSFPLVMGFLK